METMILNGIPFQITVEKLPEMGQEKDKGLWNRLAGLVEEARAIGKPKAMYKNSYIDEKGEDFVIVDGVKLTSRVLRVNIGEAYRVFPFVVTCGRELEGWAGSLPDFYDRYLAESISQVILRSAVINLESGLREKFGFKTISRMNPGSLSDWPLQEQKNLFEILGGSGAAIGVDLTGSLLMIPKISVSGIWFPSETSFENCQLCPRENCPGRRAPYDESLYEKKYSRPGKDSSPPGF